MIQFTCPGCKAAHTANSAFANRRAKCVRCGANMYIPTTDGEATFAPYSNLPNSSAPPPDSSPSATSAETESAAESPTPKYRRKQVTAVAVVLLLLLAGCGLAVYFLVFNKPAEPTKKKATTTPEAVPIDEPKPPEPYEFVGPILPPLPPPMPVVINAERLFEELARDRTGTNARYQGKLMEVRGECQSFRTPKVYFRTAGQDSGVTAVVPEYVPRFTDRESGLPTPAPVELSALVGGSVNVNELPPEEKPTAGRPVTVRGVYRMDGELHRASVSGFTAPADPLYLGKQLTVVGVAAGADDDDNGLKRVYFRKRGSAGLVEVIGRLTKAASSVRLKAGDVVAVSGKCSGRTGYVVQLENCTVVPAGGDQLSALKLALDYEEDVLKYPPILPDQPAVRATAEEFANAYRDDPDKANARFEHRVLELTGVVLKREVDSRRVRFEVPTDNPLQVWARFEPAEYKSLSDDEDKLTVRAEFRGAARGQKVITLTDCTGFDPDDRDPKVKKLTADYLPVANGRRWEALRVQYPPEQPKKPETTPKPKPDPKKQVPLTVTAQVQRLHYQTLPDGQVVGVQLQTGTFAGDTLSADDAPDIKWIGKPLNPAAAPQVERFWLRGNDRLVEIGSPKPGADGKPEMGWQPLVRLNAKLGREWESEPAAGQSVRTRVAEFFVDGSGRECVRVVSTFSDVKQPDVRRETAVVYAKGIGEVWQTVKGFDKEHKDGVLLMEQKRVRETLGLEAAVVLGGWVVLPQPDRRWVNRTATAAVCGGLTAVQPAERELKADKPK